MTDETVEGWSNRPTWCVNMWLANDRKLYGEALQRVRKCGALVPGVDRDTARGVVAANFKQWVTNDLAPDLGNTFAADLLAYALSSVDWHELAVEWIDNAAQVPA